MMTDVSMAPIPSGVKIPKREKFKWSSCCDRGKFIMIPKKQLNIDESYQRGEVSKNKVLQIARRWDWRLFGALSVVSRDDGSFWVYDGGHRLRAAFYRDDINELPCMVFVAGEIQEEAKAFVGANTMKSTVSAYHVYRASIKAGEPVALTVKAILDKHGYIATLDGKKSFGFSAIATMRNMVQDDPFLADKVFGACVDIADDGEQPSAGVCRGLFVLAKKLSGKIDIFGECYIDRLKKQSLTGIDVAIRREKHIAGQGGGLVEAKAILDLLNRGVRKKIKW